jgi:hypothetical protein
MKVLGAGGGGGSADRTGPPGARPAGRQTVTSDALNSQPASEVNKLFDKMCGDRVYDGPRWWEDPEAHGYTVYNGRD